MSKIEKFKNHLKEHKREYLIGGSCLVGGVLIGAMVKRPIYIQANAALPPTTVNVNTPVNNNIPVKVTVKPEITVNPVVNVNNTMGGYQQKLVKCLETGQIFESVKAAAAQAGVNPSYMSNHINGRTDHIMGNHYEIAGLGTKSA